MKKINKPENGGIQYGHFKIVDRTATHAGAVCVEAAVFITIFQ